MTESSGVGILIMINPYLILKLTMNWGRMTQPGGHYLRINGNKLSSFYDTRLPISGDICTWLKM